MLGERMFRQVLTVCLLVYIFSAKGYIQVSDTSFSLQTAQAIVTRGRLDIPYVWSCLPSSLSCSEWPALAHGSSHLGLGSAL